MGSLHLSNVTNPSALNLRSEKLMYEFVLHTIAVSFQGLRVWGFKSLGAKDLGFKGTRNFWGRGTYMIALNPEAIACSWISSYIVRCSYDPRLWKLSVELRTSDENYNLRTSTHLTGTHCPPSRNKRNI